MSEPKLHHYVPRFHLRRFVDEENRLWAWDRDEDRVFESGAAVLAAEKSFYFLDSFSAAGHDPLEMEKQFAGLENDVARITGEWLERIRAGERGMEVPISEPDRKVVALYIALQYLRTPDARGLLGAAAQIQGGQKPDELELRALHADLLWNEGVFGEFRDHIASSAWIFGRNGSAAPFITSDNPVAFRTADHRKWLRVGILDEGTYAVFPIAPDLVLYCYPEQQWPSMKVFDGRVSPVEFSEEMVESENGGQVFMATRFVISPRSDFSVERAFALTITEEFFSP